MDWENMILSQLEQLDLSSLLQISGFLTEFQEMEDLFDFKSFLLNILHGESLWSYEGIIQPLIMILLGQLKYSLTTCSVIIILSLLSGIMGGITSSFGNQTVSAIGSTICTLISITLLIHEFLTVYHYAAETMDTMIFTVQSLFPVLIPLVIASGTAMTSTMIQPVILSVITGISTILDQWILPAVFYSCSLCIIGRLVDQNFMNRIGKLIRDGVVFCLGLTVTLLSAVTTIQGAAGRTADSLLMKTARYSVDNFIPLIGGFAADSMDLVIQCTLTIKNAIGIWGILVLLLLMIVPLVRFLSILLMYRLCSVMAEAVEAKPISGCMEDMASALSTLAVIYTLLGILFIVFLSIVIAVI